MRPKPAICLPRRKYSTRTESLRRTRRRNASDNPLSRGESTFSHRTWRLCVRSFYMLLESNISTKRVVSSNIVQHYAPFEDLEVFLFSEQDPCAGSVCATCRIRPDNRTKPLMRKLKNGLGDSETRMSGADCFQPARSGQMEWARWARGKPRMSFQG